MGCGRSKVVEPLKISIPSPTPPPPTPTPSPPPPPPPPPPLPRDRVEIELDKGKDEGDVVYEVDGYPDPTPPTEETDVKLKNADNWYDDDEFNKASDDADLFDTEAGTDDVSIFSNDAVGGRPGRSVSPGQIHPKTTKRKPTLSYTGVDAHAKKAGNGVLDSFDALVKYLSDPWISDRHSKILIARSILSWMGAQRVEDTDFGEPRQDTPRGLLAYLKAGRMTYSTCYAVLCRKAGLQCVVIQGLVKAARYEPGDKSLPECNWTAFHCEYGWQLVHPYWMCRALCGHSLGGWTKVEADGMALSARQKETAGVRINTFQERYFMPKPSEFLYECFPFNTAWQLVDKDLKVRSKQEFIDLPYLLPPFHGLGLQWQSERKCVLQSQEGFCRIELKGRTTNAHLLNMQYELFRKSNNGDTESDKLFPRMVFNSRSNEHFIFDIRFPAEGTYKLVVYGGPYKSTALRLFEVLIHCKKKMPKSFNLLPLNCADIGYGPGPVSMNAGLLMPSKPNGLIAVNKNDKDIATEIKFHIRDDFVRKHKYSASIYGSGSDEDVDSPELIDGSDEIRDVGDKKESKKGHLKLTITKEYHLVILVRLPAEGEYGVTICDTIQTGSDVRAKTVCNYLVSTIAYHGTFMKANERLAKKSLLDACSEQVTGRDFKKKITNIEQNLDKCRRQGIKDSDEDVCMAETEREFLRCKDLLRDCHLRDNFHVTMRALAVMARYRNRAALRKEIKEVEELRTNQESKRDGAPTT
ncbi:lim and transglutaminase domain protein ltd-1-like [Dreissena polymorpha]|uniref:KY-like immunoglobulin-like domain-containing protein n=1 Tax=Dreissena polymorpha TaxID=45954 RepID=A0A9D4F150_DREPO|nr:lim and transglutaminase domain protein ltd-1-like [Dreissena polymorpha]XP_052226209.1 lim and transglutaminase domain protein ltd-1-like [Dreissena polymorpha]KAH3787770.1 hypothetical protein DPMN_165899 [Dreissena polymorpha]